MNCEKCEGEIVGVGFSVTGKRICLKCYVKSCKEETVQLTLSILTSDNVKISKKALRSLNEHFETELELPE